MMTQPSGCRYCGIPERGHGRQYTPEAGWHSYRVPEFMQIVRRHRENRNNEQ